MRRSLWRLGIAAAALGTIAAGRPDAPEIRPSPANAVGARPSPANADGARLYARECAACHGPTGEGDGPDAPLFAPPPPDLHPFIARHDRADVVRRILDGETIVVDATALRRRAQTSEALVSHVLRLGNVDWPRAERGRSLYAERCARCHGPFGRPWQAQSTGPRPATLSDPRFQAKVDDRALERAVRHASPGMPRLAEPPSADEARALVAYVRLLSPGYESYARYCAACHGEEGVPPGEGSARRRRPTLAFDRAYAASHDPRDVRAKVWHMLGDQMPSMPHLRGELSESEARAIADFLKSH